MEDNKKAYSRQKHRIAIINLALSPAVLFLFIVLGIPLYLKNISISISSNDYLNLIVFSALAGVIYYIAMLPLAYYSDFILEHKYSLSNQSLKDWVKRETKKGIVSFIISIPLIVSLYIFLRYWTSHWWLLTAALWFFISILISKFAPILIVPLFYKYSPIKNASLKERLVKLAKKAGFRIEAVYQIDMSKDTRKANAALMGLGRQKRIVLCDTLLGHFTDDEIESVMGHELGHHRMRHTLKLILFGGISTLILFFITNIFFLKLHNVFGYNMLYGFESLVLVYAIVSVLNIAAVPIHNVFSRQLEKEADLFTLKITNNKDAFIHTMERLSEQNLSDPEPGKFYEIMLYSHPPISRRISVAKATDTETQGISQKD